MQAIQKHLATLNCPQQERLRQAITFTDVHIWTIPEESQARRFGIQGLSEQT
jgi:hypothetical protein